MKVDREARTADVRPTSDRRILWLAAMSLVFASISATFAWRGGLWATPLWLGLAIAAWRRPRRREPRWVGAGALLVTLALVVGTYGFASSGWLGPALRTEKSSYVAGETVAIRLKAGIRTVGYNLCPDSITLERLGEDGWKRGEANLFPTDEEWVCLAYLGILSPLLSTSGQVHLPPDLPSGLYRLGYDPEVGGERREVRTPPFAVTP